MSNKPFKQLGKDSIVELHESIAKRPTFMQIISLAVAGIAITLGIFYFLMNVSLTNQSKALLSETKTLIVTAAKDHQNQDYIMWASRKSEVVLDVLKKIANRK